MWFVNPCEKHLKKIHMFAVVIIITIITAIMKYSCLSFIYVVRLFMNYVILFSLIINEVHECYWRKKKQLSEVKP
jgi:glucan phosphoethanolaminetransferase (alkaline phosphatase superfamily)